MVETLSELLESAANVAEDNGGKLSKCGLKEAKDFVDTYCDYVL